MPPCFVSGCEREGLLPVCSPSYFLALLECENITSTPSDLDRVMVSSQDSQNRFRSARLFIQKGSKRAFQNGLHRL